MDGAVYSLELRLKDDNISQKDGCKEDVLQAQILNIVSIKNIYILYYNKNTKKYNCKILLKGSLLVKVEAHSLIKGKVSLPHISDKAPRFSFVLKHVIKI